MQKESERSSAIVYVSTWEAIQCLPSVEQKFKAIEHIMNYSFYGDDSEISDPLVKMIWLQANPNIDAAQQRYDRAVENGKKGGRPSSIDKEKIIALYNKGATQSEIKNTVGCGLSTVKNVIRQYSKETGHGDQGSKTDNNQGLITVNNHGSKTDNNLKFNIEFNNKFNKEKENKFNSDNEFNKQKEKNINSDSDVEPEYEQDTDAYTEKNNVKPSDSISASKGKTDYTLDDFISVLSEHSGYSDYKHIKNIINKTLNDNGYELDEFFILFSSFEHIEHKLSSVLDRKNLSGSGAVAYIIRSCISYIDENPGVAFTQTKPVRQEKSSSSKDTDYFLLLANEIEKDYGVDIKTPDHNALTDYLFSTFSDLTEKKLYQWYKEYQAENTEPHLAGLLDADLKNICLKNSSGPEVNVELMNQYVQEDNEDPWESDDLPF